MYDLIVIGAGPCGVMASIQASKTNKVLLIEQNNDILKKFAISGNGRCNLTNKKDIKNFLTNIDNLKFIYPVIKSFSPTMIIEYFNKYGVKLKEENDNRIFPESDLSLTLIDALKKQLTAVTIKLNEKVLSIEKENDLFIIKTNINTYTSRKLVLATGGQTYPSLGASVENYNLSLSLNHTLTKLTYQECPVKTKNPIIDLMGLSLSDVTIIIKENNKHIYKESGDVLFTHFGLSGPGILNCSFAINKATKPIYISLQLLNTDFEETKKNIYKYIKDNPKKKIKSFLLMHLPKRLTNYLVDTLNLDTTNSYLTKENIQQLSHYLSNFSFEFDSFFQPEFAFLTGGGISTKEINSKTLESKLVPNLYLGGEMIDVCGKLGGYNITIALACGYVIGNNI